MEVKMTTADITTGPTIVGSTSSEMDLDEAAMEEDIVEAANHNEGIGEMSATHITEELTGTTTVRSIPSQMGLGETAICGDAEPSAPAICSFSIGNSDKSSAPRIKDTMKDHDELLEICSNMAREVMNWRINANDGMALESMTVYVEILMAMNRHAEAQEILKVLLEKNPKSDLIGRLRWMRMLATSYADAGDSYLAYFHLKEAGSVENAEIDERFNKALKDDEGSKTRKTWAKVMTKHGMHRDASPYFYKLRDELPSEPTNVDSLRNFADVAKSLAKTGDFKSAKVYQQAVLSKLEKETEKDGLSICNARHALAEIHRGLEDYDTARELHEENVAFLTDQLGPTHELTLAVKECLADTYSDMGMRLESVKHLTGVVNARLNQLGPENGATVSMREELVKTWFGIVMRGRVIGEFWYIRKC
jgi:tetratricopeptide (TPR) repeat protein